MSDTLDDLAAFLMHRTADADTSEKRRLSIFVLVGAYQEQDDPPTVEAALRNAAGAFADHPDYRAEWAVRDGEEGITIERLVAAVDTAAVDTAVVDTAAVDTAPLTRDNSIDPLAAVPDRGTT